MTKEIILLLTRNKGHVQKRLLFLGWLIMSLLLLSCNKGLSPTEVKELARSDLEFALDILGGEPAGYWVPQEQNSLEAHLVDPSKYEGLIDSLILQSAMSGNLILDTDFSFEFKAQIEITPIVKIPAITKAHIN